MFDMPPPGALEPSELAKQITRKRKLEHLSQFSETDFRDRVVRPLLERHGLLCVRETCGPTEEGKDSLFTSDDQFGDLVVTAVQTKRGSLTMGSDPTRNVESALTQLRTALAAENVLPNHHIKLKPSHVFLCASGRISDSARRHLNGELRDPRIRIWGAEELISRIDSMYPELWLGIDADRFPYLRALQKYLHDASDTISIPIAGSQQQSACPLSDDQYVTLFLTRFDKRIERRRGIARSVPEIVEIPVERLPDQGARLVLILGEGGSGKTTALRRLAWVLCAKGLAGASQVPVPVTLKAMDVAVADVRLSEIAALNAAQYTKSSRSCFDDADLAHGRVVLLIDGLDEVPSELRDLMISRVLDFNSLHPKCLVALASRDYSSIIAKPALSRFQQYRIVPISVRQAKRIIERVAEGRKVGPEQTTEMLRRLQDVHGVALSPLLVTVFAATSDFTKQDIPPNISEIFAKYTELLLGRWDEKKGLRQQYQANVKDFLLRRLAFTMHQARRTSIGEMECRELFATELSRRSLEMNASEVFDEVVLRSGLLRLDGDAVGFRHQLLQEFFAGRAVSDSSFFRDVVHDEWWRTAIVFHFGDKPETFASLRAVADGVRLVGAADLFEAAVTLGLATQACYLAESNERKEMLRWVVQTLASTLKPYVIGLSKLDGGNRPTMAFMYAYLRGRDAVGCRMIEDLADECFSLESEELGLRESVEARQFWILAGLIEASLLTTADRLLQAYDPTEKQFLMAIELGLRLIANLRITSDKDKQIADGMANRIAPGVEHLRAKVLTELKGLLLELRHGRIVALDAVQDDATSPGAV